MKKIFSITLKDDFFISLLNYSNYRIIKRLEFKYGKRRNQTSCR